MLTKKELEGFRKMFEDARVLSNSTDDHGYWFALRDALARESALQFLFTNNAEYIFISIQLCQLGDGETHWQWVEERLNRLRKGEMLPELEHGWRGSWAWTLQTIYRSDWEAQDVIRRRFFQHIPER